MNALPVDCQIIGTKPLETVKFVHKLSNMILTKEVVYVQLEIPSFKEADVHPAHIQTIGTVYQTHVRIVQTLTYTVLTSESVFAQIIHPINTTEDALLAIIRITGTRLQECVLPAQKPMNSILSKENANVHKSCHTIQGSSVSPASNQNIGTKIQEPANNVHLIHIILKANYDALHVQRWRQSGTANNVWDAPVERFLILLLRLVKAVLQDSYSKHRLQDASAQRTLT